MKNNYHIAILIDATPGKDVALLGIALNNGGKTLKQESTFLSSWYTQTKHWKVDHDFKPTFATCLVDVN